MKDGEDEIAAEAEMERIRQSRLTGTFGPFRQRLEATMTASAVMRAIRTSAEKIVRERHGSAAETAARLAVEAAELASQDEDQ